MFPRIPRLRMDNSFLMGIPYPIDFETAKTTVTEYLTKLILLTGSEKLFIENFNKGVYQPDLLFDNVDVIERIKEHPLAVWKTKGI